MNINQYMQTVAAQARTASAAMSVASTQLKNSALIAIGKQLREARAELLAANQQDLEAAKLKQLEPALLDRLALTDAGIDSMLEGLSQVAALADPVGSIANLQHQPSGIQVGKMRVPLGVIGIIYESRPNVTVEAASLCIKSGNASILRGGSEAQHSNQAIARCIKLGLAEAGLPEHAVQVIETTDRAVVGKLITMPEFVDVIVPRGGKGLIERISKESLVTVIKHLDGNCHVYIDDAAEGQMAIDIAVNAKTQRYGTCNTTETLLIAKNQAEKLLPLLAEQYAEHGVELRVCEKTMAILSRHPELKVSFSAATEEDWHEEYLAPILAVKIVDGIDEAITHINHYSSKHTETIVTNDYTKGAKFVRAVDSSSVMINASTRFADGFEYGLGAEIGISTDKIHARGPVGLEGLTSEKYVVLGSGQIRT